MCVRSYHEKNKCPEVDNKYTNKTNSLYIGWAAHSLLVKETDPNGFIPNSKSDKRKISTTFPDSNGAPNKKQFGKKKDWKDTKREVVNSLSPSSSSIDSKLLLVSLSSFPKETSVKAQIEALFDTGSLAGDFISSK